MQPNMDELEISKSNTYTRKYKHFLDTSAFHHTLWQYDEQVIVQPLLWILKNNCRWVDFQFHTYIMDFSLKYHNLNLIKLNYSYSILKILWVLKMCIVSKHLKWWTVEKIVWIV